MGGGMPGAGGAGSGGEPIAMNGVPTNGARGAPSLAHQQALMAAQQRGVGQVWRRSPVWGGSQLIVGGSQRRMLCE